MKILLLSVGDNGGGCYWMADAINKHTEHQARSVRFVQSWINYPFDIFAPTSEELRALIKWADVVHVRDNVSDKWPALPGNKPVVITWTGMSYRRAAPRKLQICKDNGWVSTVSTPDLIGYAPKGLEPAWLPNPREKMQPSKRNKDFTICHAPTFRERKGSQEVIEACSKAGVKLELIENMKYIDALELKARCDIVIDQVGNFSFGYGNNAIEGWALDMPVISGYTKERFAAHTISKFGRLPYLFCDGSIGDIMAKIELLRNPVLYGQWVETGLDYFYQFHHAPIVAKKAIVIYERAMK